ncbi:MAG: pantoate--beta-alanine ligase [Syntrophus sp. (in: bacteria)]|nr:pantoate--beta-alanine ligase [Syntrophus sp. (in: bacteria)]
MRVVKTVREMQALSETLRKEKRIGFVPTMGYLHEGHLALVRKAREISDIVVVSIFVNPMQFGPAEDLSRYPRDFERDAQLLETEKTDIIFFPEAGDVYPEGYSTQVEVKGLEDYLCGKTRTGHFVGVATVVNKLFNIVKPHYAVFGQKDYQQLKIIEKMVRDLNMDLEVVPYPTIREAGGLAMSSRNTYLSPEEREKALLIYASMKKAEELFVRGERNASIIREEVRKVLSLKEGINIEYISISHADTLKELEEIPGKALLAIACRVGKTRLIDNTTLMEA